MDSFRELVVSDFVSKYDSGETPIPCVLCNQFMKFDFLLKRALELDADFLATGHYARISRSAETGEYSLERAVDPAKDQSYFLFTLGQRELQRLIFPLGDKTKTEVRKIAESMGLRVATKAESMGVCFITGDGYREFLEPYLERGKIEGDIVDMEGNPVARHRGIASFTIGQRRGLGFAKGKPMYVVGIDAERNEVRVGEEKKFGPGVKVGASAGTLGASASFSFTGGSTGNWATPQTVTVEVGNDWENEDYDFDLVHAVDNQPVDRLSRKLKVDVKDVTAGLTVSKTALTVGEGETATVEIRIIEDPVDKATLRVDVPVASWSSLGVAFGNGSNFDANASFNVRGGTSGRGSPNWQTPIVLVVKALKDADNEDNEVTIIPGIKFTQHPRASQNRCAWCQAVADGRSEGACGIAWSCTPRGGPPGHDRPATRPGCAPTRRRADGRQGAGSAALSPSCRTCP